MFRPIRILCSIVCCSCLVLTPAVSQISKQLDQKTKETQSAQDKSWQQVDQINKDTDRTNARLQQARQSAARAGEKSDYTVRKTRIGTAGAYRTPKPQKPAAGKKTPRKE